jgi:3-deoxy-D-manno-octulosonic-acid transferase
MLSVYTILYAIALIILLPFEYLRRPGSLKCRWLHERLGIFPAKSDETEGNKNVIWIHAVSVGEAAAAVPLVKKIKALHLEADIVISTVTDTGQKVASERMGRLARIVYVPFDLPGCIRGAVNHINPSLFIIMETELWPNIIRIMKQRGTPVLMMNGRISEKSFRGYSKAGFFIKGVLNDIAMFCMQEEQYAERIRLLGASKNKIAVTGNLKFDMQPASGIPEWTNMLEGLTIIAGSTHRPEEDIVLDAYEKLARNNSSLNLILAPRHPQRFAEVEELVKTRKLSYVNRSEIKSGVRKSDLKAGVIVILDVIGELAAVYGAADIAVMGGSFIPHGGQNPLEPAFWGKAIVCGPHMENFPFMDDFYSRGAAFPSKASNLAEVLDGLIRSEEKRKEAGAAAKTFSEVNMGATDRAMEIVKRYIN